ncbi:NAD-glutamate dehydrogenase [Terrihabitans soli]|uniref:NAD-glutamate dehydrogenase n=1 Tax=Terrihabitans soli TaxID=708113 RepID=A0A6S6QKT6_9HYPH|nr:NAD-glutamate dehydrogenase [Terrihabitans soli]BCJ89499.1 NAD-glutamate dehydrogenase [Terrihabitans soli]
MTPAEPARHQSSADETGTPPHFTDALFGRTPAEDMADLTPADLTALADAAWAHLKNRKPGRHDLKIFNPLLPGGAEITVIEAVNDDMPFLLDSTVAELAVQGIEAKLVAHPVLDLERDKTGALTRFSGEAHDESRERDSLIHLHIERIDDQEKLAALAAELERTYEDIRVATGDFDAMRSRVEAEISALKTSSAPVPPEELQEAVSFLTWLIEGNFVFVGLRDNQDVEAALSAKPDAGDVGLGILRDPEVRVLRRGRELVAMTPEIRQFLKEPVPLIVTKASLRSRVHRRAHLDYIGIKRFDREGRVTGELRIVGLFTGTAYSLTVESIPLLRRKVEIVTRHAGFDPDSYSARALANILETYPRDELFQVDVDTLYDSALRMLAIYERPRVRAVARPDRFDRFVSVLVYVPREKYDSDVRARIGERLAETYHGRVSAFHPSFLEGVPLTRVHYIIGRYEGTTPKVDIAELERRIAAEVQTWPDLLKAALIKTHQGQQGRKLALSWLEAFTAGYREAFTPQETVAHIARMEDLSDEKPYAIAFEKVSGAADRISLKIFSLNRSLPLTERVPILSDMGFVAVEERTYDIAGGLGRRVFLHDMTLVRGRGGEIDLDRLDKPLTVLALAIASGQAESDYYNALVLEAGLSWRDAALLRAVSRYLRQINIAFSHAYMAGVIVKHAGIAQKIVALFEARFDPKRNSGRKQAQDDIIAEIEKALEAVESLDEDRIIRRFVNLVQAMLRTNVFQREDGRQKTVISFKLEAAKVDQLPAPRPLYEIFLSSPRVEGLHLRFGRVARGGLRWSDRPEDFRTEVLGLVKAQQVKNAVIVPVGAKGGFVPKKLPPASDRQAWMAEGTEAYRIFIRTLLDITDNLVGGKIVPPEDTVRHEGDDPYLVVAADKGTATFSDTANAIALERGFWLGDAFASGGSVGYDHKKMGITARGAWEAVKRHFREIDIDIQTTPFTVAGVGDMSGDVFGNGMLLSKQIRLVAAFDHRDIFLDPNPDPAASWEERKRLFDLPRSSWQDYNKGLISQGGGIFPRSLKSIPLSPEIKQLTGITTDAVTPQQLMTAILKLNVDLLFFGGIGTYIRSSTQSDAEVGDRANDAIRIRGKDVRAKIIGEGANLGMTQLGRVEAAFAGVRLNTDAIDNSAGVNTSDYEVNIKIALTPAVQSGKLTPEARVAFLAEMTDEVGALVLANNHRQTLALSLAQRRGQEDIGFEQRLMQVLESQDLLDRTVEFLPDDATLADRIRDKLPLTRPELAVLLAYAKNALFAELLETGVPDDPYLVRELARYFPHPMREPYRADIDAHRLRREIIATRLVNAMIDYGGPSLMVRLVGASVEQAAAAFAAVYDSFRLADLAAGLDALDAKIPGALQLELYGAVQDLLLSRIGWFLKNADLSEGLQSVVHRFRDGLDLVRSSLKDTLSEESEKMRQARAAELVQAGVPKDLALGLASLPALRGAPNAVLIAEQSGLPTATAAAMLFAISDRFGLDRLRAAALALPVTDHFERMAIDKALASIGTAERGLAVAAAKRGTGPKDIAAWANGDPASQRTAKALDEIARSGLTLAKLTIAADMLGSLVSS